MSVTKKRKYENCTICGNNVIYSPEANSTNNLQDSEVLERIKTFNYGDIDDNKISSFVVCDSCREEINIATECLKRCRALTTVGESTNSREFKDSSTQTKSPEVTIIVNQIPGKVEQYNLEQIFNKYGRIVNLYFKKQEHYPGFDNFARIRYSNEDATSEVMEAAQKGELKCYSFNASSLVTRVSDDSSPIDILPDVCLSEIFLRVDEIEDKIDIGKVCERWKRVLSHSWSNISGFQDACLDEEIRTVEGLTSILKGCGSFLKNLRLLLSDSPNARVELITEYCKNIENLQLEVSCSETVEEFQQEILSVFQQSQKLRRLCIENIDDTFNYNHLQFLPEEMLEIHLLSNDEESVCCSIDLSKFQGLEAFLLCNFDVLGDGLRGFEGLKNLEFVSFSGSRVHRNIIQDIQNFRKLKHLAIPDCGVDDVVLGQIIRRNLDLEHLDISDNCGITDLSFQYITRLSKLETLWMKNLSEVTGSELTQIPTLERLDIEGCTSIDDWTLIMMIDKSPNLRLLYAAGIATWRLLLNAEESIESNRSRRRLDLRVDEDLVARWSRYSGYDDEYDEGRLSVSDYRRPSKMDADEWSGWHADIPL